MITSKQAADYLGYSDGTLRRGRMSGKLAGVDCPVYIKRGGRIWYDKADLDAWLEQFKKIQNTAQSSVD